MDRKKILFTTIAFALGFIASFSWTRWYNVKYAPVAAAPQSSMASGAGQQAQVQATLERARNNPRDFEAQIGAARVYYEIQMFNEAIGFLKRAHEIDPRNLGVTATIANLFFDIKNYSEAESWYRQAIEIKPDEAGLYVEIAATLLHREQPDADRAIQEIQRALKIDPGDSHALEHLIDAYLVKKNPGKAEETLIRLKEAEPANNKLQRYESLIADLRAGRPAPIPTDH